MKIAQLFGRDFQGKCIPLLGFIFLISSCKQWTMDPEVQLGLTVIIAVITFIVIFTKPILGIYAVAAISITFSPTVPMGFANLYFHQWLILIALLASISSGLLLENFHTRIRSEINVPMMVFVGSLLLSMAHAPNLVLGIPFSISLLLYGKLKSRKRLILAFSISLMFISLVLTFSRSAWVGVFASILSLLVFKPKGSLIFVLCCIISAVFLFSPIHKRIFKDISDPGAQYRILKAKIAYNKFKENPIVGNGLGSFHYESQFSEIWAYRAHSTLENNYLLMLAEGGMIEFLAFLYLIITFGKKAYSLLKRIQEPFLNAILLGSVVSIISTLAAGMFEDTLFFPKNNWLIGMLMGIVIVVERIYEESLKTADAVGVEAEAKEQPFKWG